MKYNFDTHCELVLNLIKHGPVPNPKEVYTGHEDEYMTDRYPEVIQECAKLCKSTGDVAYYHILQICLDHFKEYRTFFGILSGPFGAGSTIPNPYNLSLWDRIKIASAIAFDDIPSPKSINKVMVVILKKCGVLL